MVSKSYFFHILQGRNGYKSIMIIQTVELTIHWNVRIHVKANDLRIFQLQPIQAGYKCLFMGSVFLPSRSSRGEETVLQIRIRNTESWILMRIWLNREGKQSPGALSAWINRTDLRRLEDPATFRTSLVTSGKSQLTKIDGKYPRIRIYNEPIIQIRIGTKTPSTCRRRWKIFLDPDLQQSDNSDLVRRLKKNSCKHRKKIY
jgi:hypothetical protein